MKKAIHPSSTSEVIHSASTTKVIDSASPTELDTFYKAINEAKRKPAILKITQPFAEVFIPKLSQSVFPLTIMELYNPASLDMDYHDLLKECEKVFGAIKVITRTIISIAHAK